MRQRGYRIGPIVAAAVCLAAVSCSGVESMKLTGATLEGTAQYGGTQLKAGLVIVQGQGGSSQGEIGEDGRYRVENVPLGEVTVAVNTDAVEGMMMSRFMAESEGGRKKVSVPKVIKVPAVYQDPLKSPLKTTIKEGSNTFDIAIPK